MLKKGSSEILLVYEANKAEFDMVDASRSGQDPHSFGQNASNYDETLSLSQSQSCSQLGSTQESSTTAKATKSDPLGESPESRAMRTKYTLHDFKPMKFLSSVMTRRENAPDN